MPTKRKAAPIALVAGEHYWVALDDGVSFTPVSGIPEGPHLVRLEESDGEWRAMLTGPGRGILDIGSDVRNEIVRAAWERRSLLGTGLHQQELRITWLAQIMPPVLPESVAPMAYNGR